MVLEKTPLAFFQWLFGNEITHGAIFDFFWVTIVLAVLGIFLGYLVAVVRHGPIEAFFVVGKTLFDAGPDLLLLSPRRILAVARLVIQESIRLRVFVVLGVFVVIMLFGGWFVDVKSDHPARVYLDFVLTSTSFLSLILALFLSAFSIPNDIKNRTIHTVVTKPVRSGEIVLGRVFGIGAVGTLFLVVMGLLSYVFVIRGMAHSHQIAPGELILSDEDAAAGVRTGRTTLNAHHRHNQVTVDAHGRGYTDVEMGHRHRVLTRFDVRGTWEFTLEADENELKPFEIELSGTRDRPTAVLREAGSERTTELDDLRLEYAFFGCTVPGVVAGRNDHGVLKGGVVLPSSDRSDLLSMIGVVQWPDQSKLRVTARQTASGGEQPAYRHEVGPQQDAYQSRVPHYGKLHFIDRTGERGDGISVGKEWTYRRYIEGDNVSKAVWTFDDISEDRFEGYLPLELTLSVWRSHKGDIEKSIRGTYQLVNPTQTNIRSDEIEFVSEEFATQRLRIERKLLGRGADGRPRTVDVFDDLVDNGRLELWIRCNESGQFFGAAQADAYLREADTPFAWNFAKGYISLWLQMIIVICFGVMFSTFLSGAVAAMATITSVAVGCFTEFIIGVAISVKDAKNPGAIEGGGPLESAIRVLTQKNISQDLEVGEMGNQVVHYIDTALMFVMTRVAYALPDFSEFITSDYVANGFDINADVLATHCAITLAFFLVLSGIGYFFLKSREIAA